MSLSFLSATTSLTRSGKRFMRAQQGSVSVMVGAALFVLVVAAGAATDMSRESTLKSKLGNALDGATLAAAEASLSVPCNTTPQAWATEQGQKYFNANFPASSLGSGSFTPTFTLSQDGASVVGSASTTMSAPFMQVVGTDYVPVDACSMVHIPLNNTIGPSVTNTSPHVLGDVTTGLYTNATGPNGTGGEAQSVGIAGGGVSRFFIDNTDTYIAQPNSLSTGSANGWPHTQSVWIGSNTINGSPTTFPSYGPQLHINGSTNAGNTDDVYFQTVYDSLDMTEFRLTVGDNASTPFEPNGTGDAFVIGAEDYTKGFAWTPRFTFTSNGNLGIGTTTPQASLDIAPPSTSETSAIHINSTYNFSSTGTNIGGNIWIGGGANIDGSGDMVYDGGTDSVFEFNNTGASSGSTRFINGTNNLLELDNSGYEFIDNSYSALPDMPQGAPAPATPGPAWIYSQHVNGTNWGGGRRTFSVNSDEVVGGALTARNLWIGGNDTAANNVLAVGSSNQFSVNNDGQIVIVANSTSGNGPGDIWADARGIFETASSTGTTGTGHVEILGAQGNITATGNIWAAGTVSWSDRRLKQDILPYTADGLSLVEQLKPVTFNWKKPSNDDMKRPQLGFIAQEVQPLVPQAVTEQNDKDKTLGINYNMLVPVLTKAIQQQQDEIVELRKEVAALKAAKQ